MPQTLHACAHHELINKKGRFIACGQPITDRAQAVVAALSAGGLVRAYMHSVAGALMTAETVAIVRHAQLPARRRMRRKA